MGNGIRDSVQDNVSSCPLLQLLLLVLCFPSLNSRSRGWGNRRQSLYEPLQEKQFILNRNEWTVRVLQQYNHNVLVAFEPTLKTKSVSW